MICPRCRNELREVSIGTVKVDVCQDGCGGIWFDAFELEKMDQPDESAGWLLDNIRINLDAKAGDLDEEICCPHCEGLTLMRQRYRTNESIQIDKCRACGGIWLDFGELYLIRAGNPSSQETRAHTAALFRGLRAGS